jgi:hypothetical protein
MIMSAGLIAGVGLAPAASAADASPPPPEGQWTFVGDDAFEHYACKESLGAGKWSVNTATYRTDPTTPPDIGVYAAIIKGRGEETATVIDSVTSVAWEAEWVYTAELVGSTKRRHALWIQGAYYGPPAYDGELRLAIKKLIRCS